MATTFTTVFDIFKAATDVSSFTGAVSVAIPGSPFVNSVIATTQTGFFVRPSITEIDVARGLQDGITIINKYGRNPDVDTGATPEDVWGGDGVYPGFPTTSGETVQVLSDSANDTSAGTGARTMTITGLNTSYALTTETFTLNGVTPVTGATTFIRVHTASVNTAGSGGFNAGTITVRHSTTTANVFLQMLPGIGETNCSAFTIPAGKTGYITRVIGEVRGGVVGAFVNISLWIREDGASPRLRRPCSIGSSFLFVDDIFGGIRLPEKTDIIYRVTDTQANNAEVVTGYDLVLVDN